MRAHSVHQPLDAVPPLNAEGSRRLVHEDDAPAPGDGARDRDRLPLPPRQRLARDVDEWNVDPNSIELGSGLGGHPAPVDPTEPAERTRRQQLASKEEVRPDAELRHERERLVDGLDPDRT